MSQIRYFSNYSQKENIVTNNVLLMMRWLYDYNRLKFGRFFAYLDEDADHDDEEASNVAEHLQLQFRQQRRTKTSVVDGFIAQESIKIVVETKLNEDDFSLDQLKGHLSAFDGESHRLLVLLSPGPTGPSGDFLEKIREEGKSKGINTLHTTFEKVIAAAKCCLSDHDEDMLAVVEDFAVFCSDKGLLPRDKFRMFTPPCGQSFDDNRDYSLYYCPVSWKRRPSEYLGIYADKSVQLTSIPLNL